MNSDHQIIAKNVHLNLLAEPKADFSLEHVVGVLDFALTPIDERKTISSLTDGLGITKRGFYRILKKLVDTGIEYEPVKAGFLSDKDKSKYGRSGITWTDDLDGRLLLLAKTKTAKDIALELNTTAMSVYKRCERLGITLLKSGRESPSAKHSANALNEAAGYRRVGFYIREISETLGIPSSTIKGFLAKQLKADSNAK